MSSKSGDKKAAPESSGKTDNASRHSGGDDEENVTERLPLAVSVPPPPPPPRDVLIGPTLFVIISFVAFVFAVVAIPIPWYRVRQYKPALTNGLSTEGLFYLFKSVWKEGSSSVTTHPSDYCWPVGRRVRALQAFAIVSAALTLFTFVGSVLLHMKGQSSKPLRTLTMVCTAFAFISLTVEVSLNFNVYLWSFADCGAGTSYHSQLYEPYAGFGLVVTAWVLTAVGGIIGSNNPTIPMDARTVDQSIHAFTLLALVSMLFSTVAAPIPHWFYKNGETQLVTDVLLWRHRVGKFDWNLTSTVRSTSVWVTDLGCDSVVPMFRAAESFSVISIFFNACSGATGFLLWKSLMGTRVPSVIFSYLGCVTSLVLVALELRLYYGDWCGGMYNYNKQFYVLSAGFALVTASFCIMCVASVAITVAYVLTERYFPAKKPTKTAKQIIVEECR